MYPRLSDIFQDLFGFSLPFPIYSFGAMLAVAFLVAAWLARKRLDEMYADGEIGSVQVELPDDKGRKRKQEASPSVLVGTITIIAVAAGLVGAKLFHILENLGPFMEDPAGMIFSTGGLTFYGGLICAGLAIVWYARKKDLSVGAVADAIGPTVLLAYGIGRIGCYLAGDGDWGVCSNLADKPGWLPAWLWSEDFSNSILGAPATVLENCPPGADGVYPTMLYEFAMASVLFGILWGVRKHPFKRGWLFMLFLTFAGIERLLIEQIRVNNEFDLFGIVVTQAEVISVSIIAAGLLGLAVFTRRREPEAQPDEAAASA